MMDVWQAIVLHACGTNYTLISMQSELIWNKWVAIFEKYMAYLLI